MPSRRRPTTRRRRSSRARRPAATELSPVSPQALQRLAQVPAVSEDEVKEGGGVAQALFDEEEEPVAATSTHADTDRRARAGQGRRLVGTARGRRTPARRRYSAGARDQEPARERSRRRPRRRTRARRRGCPVDRRQHGREGLHPGQRHLARLGPVGRRPRPDGPRGRSRRAAGGRFGFGGAARGRTGLDRRRCALPASAVPTETAEDDLPGGGAIDTVAKLVTLPTLKVPKSKYDATVDKVKGVELDKERSDAHGDAWQKAVDSDDLKTPPPRSWTNPRSPRPRTKPRSSTSSTTRNLATPSS